MSPSAKSQPSLRASNDPTGIDTLNYKLQTVPEPTAAAGLLLGLPALLARRRRKA